MEEPRAIKARIESLGELRRLFQALRAMAASRLHEAQGALEGMRLYREIVHSALDEALALSPEGPPPREGPPALLVLGAEHGFVGGFNARLLEEAAARRRPDEALFVVGSRAGLMAVEHRLAPAGRFSAPTHPTGVTPAARALFRVLAEASGVRAVFGAYTRGGGFAPALRTILPPPPTPAGATPATPLIQIPAPELLARLAGEYLFAELAAALTESFASENAARLRVMDAADHAIADKLDTLRRAENELRQEAITSELLDVVTGGEAIRAREGA